MLNRLSAKKLAGAAVFLACALGLAGGVARAEDEAEPERARAKALLQEGARQMDERQYDRAVESFTEAYRLVPSPKVLYNLGIAYLSVARYADALDALERFLAGAPDAPEANLATARRHVADLRGKVSTLAIKSDQPGADLTLDGRARGVVTFDHELTIDAGPHELRARAGDATLEERFTAVAGQRATLELSFAKAAAPGAPPVLMAPPADAPPPLVDVASTPARAPLTRRPVFWVVVGAAAVVATAVILTLVLSKTEYPAVDQRIDGP
jgi:tetratricopeptide (TPR) repeat protein